ncbi:MAG: DUF1028 domain-containing protein [Planctomycetota bacterium]
MILSAGHASATWSILLMDLGTGEIAVGSATCLTNFDLQANTPVLIPGVGAATAQSFVDRRGFNRTFLRDGLADGLAPGQILDGLSVFDPGHQTRQYGIVSLAEGVATFSGTGAGGWAGGITGVLPGAGVTGGDIAYAIQGNVLTGEPVVLGALEAVESTPGDLAAKLLAGMREARGRGGDGRCSCAPLGPENCGPQLDPAQFEKSSDIAYMLLARPGDDEGCAPVYRQPAAVGGLALADDRAVAFVFSDLARLDLVETDDRAAPGRLTSRTEFSLPAAAGDVLAADLTGDGLDELVAFAADGSAVWLIASEGDGRGVVVPLPASGATGAAADIDGDGLASLVVLDPVSHAAVVLSWDGDALQPVETVALEDAPTAVAARDTDGDGRDELAVVAESAVSGSGGSLTMIGHGIEAFAVSSRTTIGGIAAPSLVEMADLFATGRPLVFVAGTGGDSAAIFEPSGIPALSPIVGLPGSARDLTLILDADGRESVLAACTLESAVLGPFSPTVPIVIPLVNFGLTPTPTGVIAADLDGDGDSDLIAASPTDQIVRLVEQADGGFPLTIGCGDGEFYLELNVAFAQSTDPDPVDQLEGLFADWAERLAGTPDAYQSIAELRTPLPRSLAGCETRIRIDLRDREDQPAAADTLRVVLPDAGADVLAVAEVNEIQPGLFDVVLVAGGQPGSSRVLVTAAVSGSEPVLLAHPIDVVTRDPADLTDDGVRDAEDFEAWVAAFTAGRPAADQNGDGEVSPSDFFAFAVNFRGGCG